MLVQFGRREQGCTNVVLAHGSRLSRVLRVNTISCDMERVQVVNVPDPPYTIQVSVDQDMHDRFIAEHFHKMPNTEGATRYFYTIFEKLWRQFVHHFMWLNTTKWRNQKVITSPWKIQVSRTNVQTVLEKVFENLELAESRVPE